MVVGSMGKKRVRCLFFLGQYGPFGMLEMIWCLIRKKQTYIMYIIHCNMSACNDESLCYNRLDLIYSLNGFLCGPIR